jgi:hypothetical protein
VEMRELEYDLHQALTGRCPHPRESIERVKDPRRPMGFRCDCKRCGRKGADTYAVVPPYLTDGTQILALMDRFGLSLIRSEDGWYAVQAEDILHHRTLGQPSIEVRGRHGEEWEAYETPGEAVVRAALAASPAPAGTGSEPGG